MSYRKKHIKSKLRKIRHQKHILKRPVFWAVFLFSALILSFSYFFFLYPGFQVKDIVISGNEKVAGNDLQGFADGLVKKKIMALGQLELVSKSMFLVSSENLQKEILKKFPAIESISINRDFPQTLLLGIKERKPAGAFCENSSANPRCFLIDQSGIIFLELSLAPENVLVIKQAASDKNLFTGEEAVNKKIMDLISKIKRNLNDKFKIDIKEALISSPVRLNILTSENWQIYFNLDQDISADFQLAKLDLLLNNEITPKVREGLLYIDLRFKDRAYYK